MKIRLAENTDIPRIMQIYEIARIFMAKNGNPTQWANKNPRQEVIEQDIESKQLYIILKDNKICGVFAFIIGEDVTYQVIEDGQWLNDNLYGTIHRIASDGNESGILNAALEFCEERIDNIRIDTHHDNKIMQHLLEKNGFIKCGIIYVADGTSRIAYHKCVLVDKAFNSLGKS